MDEFFRKIAAKVSFYAGRASTFVIALLVILIWALSGPFFNYSDTWQLIINTSTTIVTFLMVFLIQNTQNRDSRAVHLKLDELIKAIHGAREGMINVEEMSDEEIEKMHQEFTKLHDRYEQELLKRKQRRPSKKSSK